jgi:hypothetical protein
MRVIVTDLTRFKKGNPNVCLAGIDPKTRQCVRPYPYVSMTEYQRLNIVPGVILDWELINPSAVIKPHVEDMDYIKLPTVVGPCTSTAFEDILTVTLSSSIKKGFDNKVPDTSKVIPAVDPPGRSIITLKVSPKQIKIARDKFDKEKIKLHFDDNDGTNYPFLPITDLGFYNLAIARQSEVTYTDLLNEFIWGQKLVFLRIGLSRKFDHMDGRSGYWLQINGIYTFPEFMTKVRTY